jgi:hypothetical protein
MGYHEDEDISGVSAHRNVSSMIGDILKEFCITHGITARIESMHVVRDEDTRFPRGLQIDVRYSPIPYSNEEESQRIERELQDELQSSISNIVEVEVEVFIRAE